MMASITAMAWMAWVHDDGIDHGDLRRGEAFARHDRGNDDICVRECFAPTTMPSWATTPTPATMPTTSSWATTPMMTSWPLRLHCGRKPVSLTHEHVRVGVAMLELHDVDPWCEAADILPAMLGVRRCGLPHHRMRAREQELRFG